MTISVRAVGDLMLGDHPLYLGIGIGSRKPVDLFDHVRPLFDSVDLCCGNLETPLLGPSESLGWESRVLRGNMNDAAMLKRAGFKVLSVANNHVWHHGMTGWQQTIQSLSSAGITPVGVREQPWPVLEINGTRVGLLAFSLRPEQRTCGLTNLPYAIGSPDDVVNQATALAQTVDTTIVHLHWGEEYLTRPTAEQRALARRLVTAGAALVLGHHPHVLQGIERIGDSLVAYSLGNFVSDMCQSATRDTGVLHVLLDRQRVIEWSWLPVRIQNDYVPVPLVALQAEEAKTAFAALCKELLTRPLLNDGSAVAKSAIEESQQNFRREFERFFARNFWRYPIGALSHVWGSAVLRRIRRLRW